MPIHAGFSEVDITPRYWPIRKYGGLHHTVYATWATDPLYAKAAVFEAGGERIAMVALDVVIIEAEHVAAIREQVQERVGIPPEHVLVCATHNHACPAVITRPVFDREEEYLAFLRASAVQAIAQACEGLQEVTLGVVSGFEGRLSFNRRWIMKDGTVKTHPRPASPDMRCAEGGIDPELGVLCARDAEGKVVGVIVNFACHAVHKMGGPVVSAGFPGSLCRRVREALGDRCTCVFVNGACANIHHANPMDPDYVDDPERMGRLLAADVVALLPQTTPLQGDTVAGITRDIRLPLRDFSALERQVQDPEFTKPLLASNDVYRASLEVLRAIRAQRDHEVANVQVLRVGEAAFACIPAEYFTEHGLRIKMESPLERTFVISLANGWVGYVPTVQAFSRPCGHETTSALWSKLVPEAGDMLADAALRMVAEMTASGA